MDVTQPGLGRLRWAVFFTLVASLAFAAFFQWTKAPAVSAVNPFAEDPVDAIGSFGIQVAGLLALLTWARYVEWRRSAARSRARLRLIYRGLGLALAAIAVTVAADGWMELRSPTWRILPWGALLAGGLALVAAVMLLAALAWLRALAVRPASEPDAAEPGYLGEALADLWGMAWLAADGLRPRAASWRLLERCDREAFLAAMARLGALDPRRHAWRAGAVLSLAAGVALAGAHGLFEGMPPSLGRFLLVSAVFVTGETLGALSGLALLGGLLGLRPPLITRRQNAGQVVR